MSRLSRLVSLSLESEAVIGDEEALNDASVHTDIVTDVEMPAQEFSDTSDEILEATNDANSLQNTADMINETTESGGQGVDLVAAKLAQEKIETAIEKYQLTVYTRSLSRESFNTASSRREVSRQLAREAEEASKGIWERIKEAIVAAVKWLRDFFDKWLTAHGRLHRRIKALKEKYSKAETEVNPSRVEMSASRLGNTNVIEEVNKLNDFLSNSPLTWFIFNDESNFFDLMRDTPRNFKHRVELFKASGGDLGGKRVGLHVRDENSENFSIEVKDFSSELKDEKIRGLTKEEGKKVLDKLDDSLNKLISIKKRMYKSLLVIGGISANKKLADYDDPSFKDKMNVLKRIIPYVISVKKAYSIAVSTSMKVASVATEVCAKSIGPAKEQSN